MNAKELYNQWAESPEYISGDAEPVYFGEWLLQQVAERLKGLPKTKHEEYDTNYCPLIVTSVNWEHIENFISELENTGK